MYVIINLETVGMSSRKFLIIEHYIVGIGPAIVIVQVLSLVVDNYSVDLIDLNHKEQTEMYGS